MNAKILTSFCSCSIINPFFCPFISSSTFFFYLKFLMLWICVISVDYLTELRFEYIWPFYLLLRSVYDSYNYKGLVSATQKQLSSSWYLIYLFMFLGILVPVHLYSHYIWSHLPLLHTCTVALLCSFHFRLGPVCLAHRYCFDVN